MTKFSDRAGVAVALLFTLGTVAATEARASGGPDLTVEGGAPPDDAVPRAAPLPSAAPPGPELAAPPPLQGAPVGEVAAGFYRDPQGRVMQVSFDFGRRIWLGVGYAPRLRTTGETEVGPAAFDFGASWETLSPDARTRHRFRLLDGQVRLNSFGLDLTGFSYDLSHRYDQPLLRITTFVGEPERHDLYLNVGLYTEALHYEVAPRGIDGEQELTLGSVQATLDLWQSADLRSYVRVRSGPGVEMRIGPWGEEQRFIGFLPQAVLEGNLIFGARAIQLVTFRLRGEFLRSVAWSPEAIPGGWLADGEAAYETILVAINDQPVSFRLAAQAGVRGDVPGAAGVAAPAGAVAPAGSVVPGWEWKGTAGIRVSFFSPPVSRR